MALGEDTAGGLAFREDTYASAVSSALFAEGGDDYEVVCTQVGQFVARVTGGDGTDALPVFVAVIAAVLGLYRARDRVKIAMSLPGGGVECTTPPEEVSLADLSVSPDVRLRELATIAARALCERGNSSRDTPIDAIVGWHQGGPPSATLERRIRCNRGELLFNFVLDADVLRVRVQAPGTVSHRISPSVIADVVAEIVRCLTEQPTATVGELHFVSAAWRHKLLVQFNGQPIACRKDRTILSLFEECVARAGDRPAITFGEDTYSYAELDRATRVLAGRLHAAGVVKGDLIPVVGSGGIELPIAMIALMKLGAAFVPIDVAWPDERLRVIFAELRPKLALYREPSEIVVTSVPSMCFTALSLDGRAPELPAVELLPEDLIYGFFTSGSTGVPKCALNLHGGLLNRFLAMSRRFGAHGDDVVLQNSKHVFDSSIWQLLWPLTTGSQVVIPQERSLFDLSYTIALIERHRVTMTDFVPSIFNTLIELIESDRSLVPRLNSLRHLLIGGEEIGARAVQKFRGMLAGCGITNTYGPTEASIGCVFHEVRDEDGSSIPIGRPIDNCYVAIVDPRGAIVPPGAVGEILIGGDCLGRGYLNDRARTDAAFVANTFAEIPGPRLYRTGDLGYYRPDGNIHFVGRQDQQIKLGGVRIELTEIEAVIATHSAVHAVKVIVEGKRWVSPRLVAYVVAEADTGPEDIRSVVAGALPGYCVPKQVFLIDRMPLTPNGKVDRQMLAVMTRNREMQPDEAVLETERRIRATWLELLALDRVGIHDDFFASGGDSLIAVRLGLRLTKEFGCKVLTRDIYSCPTISMQAAFMRGDRGHALATRGATLETTLRAASSLDPGIVVDPGAVADAPHMLFLTGATGFVGSHLLRGILTNTSAHVICLVRAPSDEAASARLREALQHHRIDEDRWVERVTAIAGDLELPHFGLSEGTYDFLAGATDTVVHNGAVVNFLLEYTALCPSNVVGTREIIRFAARRRPKRLHYISTLAALPANAYPRLEETELTTEDSFPADGYGQSKSVAERLLAEARRRGVAATTYRLGEVMPHSRTGIANSRALLDTLIRSCLKLGISFTTSLRLNYTPVDYVARFLAGAIAVPSPAIPVFHVLHPVTQALETIFERFRNAGFFLRPLSYRAFHEALQRACAAAAPDPDLLLTLALMPEPADADSERTDARIAQIVGSASGCFSSRQMLTAVDRLGIAWPVPGIAALDSYAAFHRSQFCRKSDFELTAANS